jgi:hypothetical protein
MPLRILTMAGSAIDFVKLGALYGDVHWLFVRRQRPWSLSVLGIRGDPSQQGTANYKTPNQTAHGSFGHSCLLMLQVNAPLRYVMKAPRSGGDLGRGVDTIALQRRLAHFNADFHSGLDVPISAGGC